MKDVDDEKHSTKGFHIKKNGGEREIEISVVVEFYRFLFYTWFFLITLIGIALTYGVTAKENDDFYKVIEGVFGSVNVCAYFDFPPSTYILPAFYSIQVILIYKYSFLSIFRAWVAKLENKISKCGFVLYLFCFAYFCFSGIVFSTIFAVQPNPDHPETILIHTLPFTNLIIALNLLQIAVTWFGHKVSWKDLKHRSELTKRLVHIFMYICLIMLLLTSIFKIIHHINALGDVWTHPNFVDKGESGEDMEEKSAEEAILSYKGMWFNVHENKVLLQIMDKLWLLSALVLPMVQSGYLTMKSFDTHLIIFNIRDNRRANTIDYKNEKTMGDEELTSFTDTNSTI